ncbi:MAG: DinB family protein [Bacteroidetes bacterium]|nr:DinB family protein [Bacteroidota bacterium]
MSIALNGLPQPEHAAKYYDHYIKLAATHINLLECLEENKEEFSRNLLSIPNDKANYAYAEGKWTIKEVYLHIIDTERIFQGRAHRLGRNDNTPLAGFDENSYTPFSFSETRSLESINEEWIAVRNSTIQLFKNFQIQNLDFIGSANGNQLTARSAGWIMVGHAKHHLKVVEEKYL